MKGAWPRPMPRWPSSSGRITPRAEVSTTVVSGVTITQRMPEERVESAMA